MREGIGLYRGKRLDNGEWVEGNLITAKDGAPDRDFAEILVKDKHGYGVMWYEVDMDTIGQWTGLVDNKNGVKIFEGDLVVPTNRRRLANKASVVEYDPLSGYWMCSPAREPLVIGNIHDKAVEE